MSGAAQAQNPGYPYAQDPSQPYAQPGYPPGGPAPGYAPPGYAPPGAPPPGYPPTAYAAPGYPAPGQSYVGPDGLTYVNGAPAYLVDGAWVPLLFVAGLGWGYYGYGNRWFGAPIGLRARLDRFYPGGRGFPRGGFRGGPGFGGPGRPGEGRGPGFDRR